MSVIYLFILFFLSHLVKDDIAVEGTYKILSQSKVYLAGTSNVNKFTCNCMSEYELKPFKFENLGDNQMAFENTQLQLPVEYIDCKNRKMDKDLQKAMKADQYPNVIVELKNIKVNKESNEVKALVYITLAGVKRKYDIHVKATQHDQNLRVSGNKTLLMTDFGITPPQVLFGMIKVNDPITFFFDLVLEFEPFSV